MILTLFVCVKFDKSEYVARLEVYLTNEEESLRRVCGNARWRREI